MKKITIFCLILIFSNYARAFLLDINSGILQGSFNHITDQSSSKSVNSMGMFASLSKTDTGSGLFIGWYMSALAIKDVFPGSINNTLNSSDMGPALRWQIDAKKITSLTFAYGILCKGSFNDGTTDESLSGESLLVKFAVEPEIGDKFFLGVGLNYYSANYKTSVTNSIQSEVGYKNTLIFPSLSFSFRY